MTTSQSNVYNFIYDTTAGIPAVLVEATASQDPKLYIRTPDGRLIARVTATETPTLDFYYHFDGLGSTRALTDVNGDTTDIYRYGVWGDVTHDWGTTSQPYQFVGQLGYYTHYQDPKLDNGDMLQLGVRYYVPSIGRFTQRDPVRTAGESAYLYCRALPTVLSDATGRVGDDRSCLEIAKKCRQDVWNEFGRCAADALGAGGFGRNELICLTGCGAIYGLTKSKAIYKLCVQGCTGLAVACTWIGIASCDSVKEALLESCDTAYDYCIGRRRE